MLISAAKIKHITDHFIEPYFIQTDSSGIIIAACEKFETLLLNFGIDSYCGINLLSIFAEIGDHLPMQCNEIETEGWPKVFDLHLSIKTQKKQTIRWISSALATDYNMRDGWQLTGMEIPDSKNIESISNEQDAAQLQKEKNLSDSIINSMPGIFYLFDSTGKFLRWNKRLETVSGYGHDEIAGMNPIDFFTGSEKDYIAGRIEKVFT